MDTLLENPVSDEKHATKTSEDEKPARNFPQFLAAASANMVIMISGTVLGWTSPVLPRLMEPGSFLPLTTDEASWVGSLVALGAIIGPFPAGACADFIGRKKTLLATALLFLISWGLLAWANSVVLLYIGRVLQGFANGWCMTVLPMYIGEIATPNARGAMGVVGQIMITLGFLYVYSIGPFVPYFWLCIICSAIPVLFFVSFIFMPESPYYEISKNDHKAASRCLARLRGKSADSVKHELIRIQNEVEESLRNAGSWSELFLRRASRKAVFLMCSLMAFQQLAGINVVLFYSEDIFRAAGSSLSPSISTILVGLVMFLSSFATPYLIERLGRRLIMMLSTGGMMIFLIIIGGCFFMDGLDYDMSKFGWLPLISIITYIILHSTGIGPVPWAMLGEMFAPNIRSRGAAFSASFAWVLGFLITKLFSLMVAQLGADFAFWIFAVFCGLGTIFIYLLLPETKGKTLQEIQDILNSK